MDHVNCLQYRCGGMERSSGKATSLQSPADLPLHVSNVKICYSVAEHKKNQWSLILRIEILQLLVKSPLFTTTQDSNLQVQDIYK